MPLVVRKFCDAYHKLPSDVELLSLDQWYIANAPEAELQIQNVTAAELRQAGIIPPLQPGEGTSLVKRIRAKRAETLQKQRRQSKRERRREEKRMIREARARGEV